MPILVEQNGTIVESIFGIEDARDIGCFAVSHGLHLYCCSRGENA